MKKLTQLFKSHSFSFWYSCIMIFLLVVIPKSDFFFESLPIRVGLLGLFPIIVLIDYKLKKIKFNNINLKPLVIIYSLFILFTIPSLFVSKNVIISCYTIVKFILFFLNFYLFTKIDFSKKEQKTLFITFISGVLLTILYGFISYFFDVNLFKLSNYMYPGALGRIKSTFFNPCYYALFVNMLFPVVLYKLFITKGKTSWLYLIMFILLYACLIFTFTRSAVLIFIVMFVISIFLFRKIIFNYKMLLVVLSITLMSYFIPGSKILIKNSVNDGLVVLDNLTGFLPSIDTGDNNDDEDEYIEYDENSKFNDYSLHHRAAFAEIANKIANNNRYTGVGFGTYIDYMNSEEFDLLYPEYNLRKVHPHSSLILMYAETGIISIIAFSIFIFLLVLKFVLLFFSNWKDKNNAYYFSSIALLISFSFLAVSVMSENSIYDTQIFPIYLIMIGFLYNKIYKEKNDNKKVLFISSTGGHLSELLQLKPLFKKYNSYLITEKTKSTVGLKQKFDKVNYLVYGTKDHKFSYIFKFSYNIIKSFVLYIKIRPEVIITTGTHTAVPICYIGRLLGSKIIFIETFANSKTKTLSGKLIYPIANTFVVQWESMLELYPKAIYAGWIY